MERYARVFRPTEIKMMLAAFANMETVHIAAYALLLETIGMPETEFAAFMDYAAMRDKHDYMQRFGVDNEADILRTLAMFGGFTEGLQLFASFAILLNFPRHNKMRGMGQIVSWSVRDESLHCEGIIRLFHAFAARDRRAHEARARRHRRLRAHRGRARGPVHRPRLRARPDPGLTPSRSRRTSATSPTGGCSSSGCRRSSRSASIRCPGSPRS